MAYYVTDEDITTYVAAQLRLNDETTLIGAYETLIPYAGEYAYGEIRSRLLARGYTSATIDAWDLRRIYSLDLATWFLLRNAASLQASDTWVEKFNKLGDLDTVELTADDELATIDTDIQVVRSGTMRVYRNLRETFIGGDRE